MAPRPPLAPEVEAVLAELEASPGGPDDLLAAGRAGYARTAALLGGEPAHVRTVETVTVGACTVQCLEPVDARGAIVYAHGGGWVMGDLEGIDRVCRAIALASGATVCSVDYRLAPEHPYPAPLEDVWGALGWAAERWDALAVGGDSAGGNLAAACALRARDAGLALRAQLLVYPACDAAMDTDSYDACDVEGLLTRAEMEASWAAYLGDHDPADPDVSPLRAPDLAGLPPTYLAVAGQDVLRDEGLAYAARLAEAGVAVEQRTFADMPHGFTRWGGRVPAAAELHGQLGAFARAALG